MNKKRFVVFTSKIVATSLLSLSALSGCQLLTGYQQIDEAENAETWAGDIQPVAGEVNIACAGTYHCEITQIDQTLVIAPDSHEPVSAAMLAQMAGTNGVNNAKLNKRAQAQPQQAPLKTDMTPLLNQKSVKVVPLSASGMKGLTNYYARVKPAKREVHVNFYPENNVGYVERFAMIHDFTQPGTYQLRAHRKKHPQDKESLLEAAPPEPLCIELLQDSSVQRRFCKQMDTEYQGEFVETGIVNKTPAKLKVNN